MRVTKEKALEVVAWSMFVITLSGIMGIFSPPPKYNRVDATASFDHSQCQYPTRTTNPVDGCDNSDPCDPADAAKGGSGECVQAPIQQEPVETEVTAPKSTLLRQCEGGK